MTAGRAEILPPPEVVKLVYGRRGDLLRRFERMGETGSRHFLELCDVQPHERVLDIGCGAGRMALPLTRHLSPEGSYEGFDIIPEAISWCSREITPRFPNFRFRHADLFNRRYNKEGTLAARDYSFPYEDAQFDCALLWSVFTHMLPADLERYLSEIRRVLSSRGRFLATYFLLNHESLRLMDDAEFPHDHGVYRTRRRRIQESAVAYEEDYILTLYDRFGFQVTEPISYGRWPGRARRPLSHDTIVAHCVEAAGDCCS